jgi:hypothetical protein
MKRFITALLVAVLALAAVATSAALAKKPPNPQTNGQKKVWICHKTSAVKNPYVAVQVPMRQITNHTGHGAHAADIVNATGATTPVPQTKAAARAFCRAQQALTATKGGKETSGTVTSNIAGLAADISLRLRLGQGQVCLSATFTTSAPLGTSLTINSPITLQQGSNTPLTLNLAGVTLPMTGTSPVHLAGCATLSRAIVKALLQGTSAFTLSIPTSAGTVTATFGS